MQLPPPLPRRPHLQQHCLPYEARVLQVLSVHVVVLGCHLALGQQPQLVSGVALRRGTGERHEGRSLV